MVAAALMAGGAWLMPASVSRSREAVAVPSGQDILNDSLKGMNLNVCALTLSRSIVTGASTIEKGDGIGYAYVDHAVGELSFSFVESKRREDVRRLGSFAYGSLDAGVTWTSWGYGVSDLERVGAPPLAAPGSDPVFILDIFRVLRAHARSMETTEAMSIGNGHAALPVLEVTVDWSDALIAVAPEDRQLWERMSRALGGKFSVRVMQSRDATLVDMSLPIIDTAEVVQTKMEGLPDSPVAGFHMSLTAGCSWRAPTPSDEPAIPTNGVHSF